MRKKYENRLTYAECERMFRERKRRTERIKLTHNTYLGRYEIQAGSWRYAVLLHGNTILTFMPDGSCLFDMCGWGTVTTKDRMNQYGPPGTKVYTRKNMHYLSDRGGERQMGVTGLMFSRPMSEEVAHWQAIAAAPTDRLPRLIYSDWLLEHGYNLEAYEQRKLAGVAFEELRQLVA